VVPAGTLFGWDTTPAEAGGWGLLDAGETRAIVAAAARHPATRWCTTVTGPGCTAQAAHADLDHTIPYPDGPTDQCNLGPKCRRHHKAEQASGWKVEQPEPGVIRWTLPSGRTHTTRPTVYDPSAGRAP
jgi:hypothetical protein